MDTLLSAKAIVESIAINLDTIDFVHFQEVNKFINMVTKNIEPRIWRSKIKQLKLGEGHREEVDELTAFDIKNHNDKQTYITLYKIFNPYLRKLSHNDLQFKHDGVMEQAIILKNLQRFQDSDELTVFIEIFINSALRELEINGLDKKFVEVLVFLGEDTLLFEYFKSRNEIPNFTSVEKLCEFIDSKSVLVDEYFPKEFPLILKYCDGVIERAVDALPKEPLPEFYGEITSKLAELKDCNNCENFQQECLALVNVYLEPLILKYCDQVIVKFDKQRAKFEEYNDFQRQKELETELYINQTHNQAVEKVNFLTNFTKIFVPKSQRETQDQQDLSQLTNSINLQQLNTLISLDLCYSTINMCKSEIEQLRVFEKVTPVTKATCQTLFKNLITMLSQDHLKPAFDKAVSLLDAYDPLVKEIDTQMVPLIKFAELINMGDLILQMIHIFYSKESILRDKNSDFLNGVVSSKKNMETMLDDYVANGLNIGIDKLMVEVQYIFDSLQLPTDYDPVDMKLEMEPTESCRKVVEVLRQHMFLLNGVTDQGTTDLYQQEMCERFFHEVVKNIKKNLISCDGAIALICDLNYYYEFVAKLKQKQITPYFAGLKSVGQLFLVSGKDGKELGKMVCDVGKFGVFSQEELYEMVSRRKDWIKVKKHVEKVIYGLTECVIV